MAQERVSVTRSVRLSAPVTEVWALVGDFYRIHEWHPAVESTERQRIGDDEFRILRLANGGRILEHLVGRTTHSYTYVIIRSPLPVKHYEATIEADTAGAGTGGIWSGSFVPTAEDAERVVAGIYEAGLEALAERFGRG